VELSKPTVVSEDPAPRLLRWSRRDVPGFAWVEYHDERTRQRFFERFAWMLPKDGLPLHQLRLQRAETPARIVWALLEEMQALPPGICSITGFATALPSEPYALAEALYAFSFQREALGKVPHRQIWWLPSYVADALIRTVPDLESWFTLRLQIEEQIPQLTTPKGLIEPIGLRSPDPAEAARRARELITRFDQAIAKERNPIDAVQKLGLPALAAFREAGDGEISRALAERLRGLAPSLFTPTSDETIPHRRISEMLNRAHLLHQSGLLPEAAGLVETAVEEGRSAMASSAPLCELALAHALRMHGIFLDELGLKERARASCLEAVHLFRRLAREDPAANLPRLGEVLHNLAHVLTGIGRTNEALPAASEAVLVFRKLVAMAPGAHELQLALALNNLAGHLGTLRRSEEAVPLAREAVGLLRGLPTHSTASDKANLALALNNLAVHLGMSGDDAEAWVMSEEAAGIYGELATRDPQRHAPDHAKALLSLALRRSRTRHSPEALEAAKQSVELFRSIVAINPRQYVPMLEEALLQLSVQLRQSHLHKEALAAAQESLALRKSHEANSGSKDPIRLAEALLILAACHRELGQIQEAMNATLEALQHLRGVKEAEEPEALEAMGAASSTLADLQEILGQSSAALETCEQGVRQLATAFVRFPDALIHVMGPLLSQYLHLCQKLGRKTDDPWLEPIVRLAVETPVPWQTSGTVRSSGDPQPPQ
jgi:tetratricopeptide (TPR) repeat protein